MTKFETPIKCLESIAKEKEILIIQDIDGVCVPLVKDPLMRKIDKGYIYSVSKLREEFYVLTCGEHEGPRGVNRMVEKSLGSDQNPSEIGLYLPGLASCGIEFQDRFGNIKHLGLSDKEINFLKIVPGQMKELLIKELKQLFPNINNERILELVNVAVCDTRFTPTINFNEIFTFASGNLDLQLKLQSIMQKIMFILLRKAKNTELENSFYLHMMPNLGKVNNQEIMKSATNKDIGTTDIQLIINGAVKEAGLLVLLNNYISRKTGKAPFGKHFNVRNAPNSTDELINLCIDKIAPNNMPVLIGVGDTVTSNWSKIDEKWLRGGSDRGFLSLIQRLGRRYKKANKVIFVNSSNSEVKRPSVSSSSMDGVSDDQDKLKFDTVITGGPEEYIKWFKYLAETRSS